MHPTQHCLTELEIKASFTEDLLDQLNQVVIRQQCEIDVLAREVERLRQQMPETGSSGFSLAADDLPPHYGIPASSQGCQFITKCAVCALLLCASSY